MDFPIVLNAYRGYPQTALIQLYTDYVDERDIQVLVGGTWQDLEFIGQTNWARFETAPTQIRYDEETAIDIIYFDIPTPNILVITDEELIIDVHVIPNVGNTVTSFVADSEDSYNMIAPYYVQGSLFALSIPITDDMEPTMEMCIRINAGEEFIAGPSVPVLQEITIELGAYILNNQLVIGPREVTDTSFDESIILLYLDDSDTPETKGRSPWYFDVQDIGKESYELRIVSSKKFYIVNGGQAVTVNVLQEPFIMIGYSLGLPGISNPDSAALGTVFGVFVNNTDDLTSLGYSIGSTGIFDANQNIFVSPNKITFWLEKNSQEGEHVELSKYDQANTSLVQRTDSLGWRFISIEIGIEKYVVEGEAPVTVTDLNDPSLPFSESLAGKTVYGINEAGFPTKVMIIPELICDATFALRMNQVFDQGPPWVGLDLQPVLGLFPSPFNPGDRAAFSFKETSANLLQNEYGTSFWNAAFFNANDGTGLAQPILLGVKVLHRGYCGVPDKQFGNIIRNTLENQAQRRIGLTWDTPDEDFQLMVGSETLAKGEGNFYYGNVYSDTIQVIISSTQTYKLSTTSSSLMEYGSLAAISPPAISPNGTGINVSAPGLVSATSGGITVEGEDSVTLTVPSPSNSQSYSVFYTDQFGFISDSVEVVRTPMNLTATNTYIDGVWTTVLGPIGSLSSSEFSVSVEGTELEIVDSLTFSAEIDLPLGSYQAVVIPPQTMAYSFSPVTQNTIVVGNAPAIQIDPSQSLVSPDNSISQVLVTNPEELEGYTILINDSVVATINSEGFIVYDGVITSLSLQGVSDSSIDVETHVIPSQTITAMIVGDNLVLSANTSEPLTFVNQDGVVISTSNPATVPLSELPPGTVSVAIKNENGIMSEPVTIANTTVLTIRPTYNNGVTTFTVTSSNPDYDIDNVYFEINGVQSEDGRLTLELPPGNHPVEVFNTDLDWAVSWTPDPLYVFVPGNHRDDSYSYSLASMLAIIFMIGNIGIAASAVARR